jgi:hypothetical protein
MLVDMVPAERRSEMIQGGVLVMLFLGIIWAVSSWWTNRLANRIADVIEERQNARM